MLMWLLLLCASFSWAQTITISDQKTNKPIDQVSLIAEEPKVFAITNTDGQADISAFVGITKIEIRSLGYEFINLSYKQIQDANFHIYLTPSNVDLNEVIISGMKSRQKSEDVPSKIITIQPKDVAFQNPQTAADMLGISGKVFIQKSQQGGGSPMIRGFATNRLLYTVDGVRMNTAIFRGGNIQNVINLDPFSMESTEVLFGPGSVIYGSDAIGGVMSFQTLTPTLSMYDKTPYISGKAVARTSSANQEQTGHFDLNVGWKKWAILTSFSSWDYDNLRQGSNGPTDYIKPYYVQRQDSTDVVVQQTDPLLQIPSGYSQMNILQKVRFSPNKYWDIQYGFHFSETSPYGRYDRHNRVRNGTARYAEWDYGPQKWQMHVMTVKHQKQTKLYDVATLRVSKQFFEESRIDRSLNKNDRTTNIEQVDAYTVSLDLEKTTGKKNTIYYGLEWVQNDVSSTGVITDISDGTETVGPSRYPQSTWSSLAGYLNNVLNINKKLSLQAGIRFNQYVLDADFSGNQFVYNLPFSTAEINNSAITGSIGGVYRPTNTWVIRANIGTAFRSPNVDDIGKVFDSEPGAVTIPNPSLKAEYAYNADLGIAKVFGKNLKLEITGFYTQLQNALVRRDYQLNGSDSLLYQGTMSQVQALQNAAVANVYGYQAGIEWKLRDGVSVSSSLNYQHGEEELDDGSTSSSRHAAPMFGVTRLNYQAQNLRLQVYSQYQGERSFDELPEEEKGKDEIYAKDGNGNNYSPSWYTLNLKAQYNLTHEISINAALENILDKRYRPYSSGLSAPGRNFVLSVRANF